LFAIQEVKQWLAGRLTLFLVERTNESHEKNPSSLHSQPMHLRIGLVIASAGTYQTGTYQTGTYQTGTYQTGTYQTGTYQTGTYQTGTYQTGTYQTDTYQTDTDRACSSLVRQSARWGRQV
jgi:hypothetical protein